MDSIIKLTPLDQFPDFGQNQRIELPGVKLPTDAFTFEMWLEWYGGAEASNNPLYQPIFYYAEDATNYILLYLNNVTNLGASACVNVQVVQNNQTVRTDNDTNFSPLYLPYIHTHKSTDSTPINAGEFPCVYWCEVSGLVCPVLTLLTIF